MIPHFNPAVSLNRCVMDKVYLLLRNNRETGPFTIDELRQQNLGPADLVWVEGKSQAWSHPTELTELSASGSPDRSPAGAPPLVRLSGAPETGTTGAPRDEIELKAEELRRRALSFTPAYYFPAPSLPQEQKHYTAPVPVPEDEGIPIHYSGADQGINRSQWLVACMVGTLLFIFWYGSWSPVREQQMTLQPAPVRGIPVDEDLTQPREEGIKAEHALAVEAIYPRPDSLADIIPVQKPKALVVRKTEPKRQAQTGAATALRQEPAATPSQEGAAATADRTPAPVAAEPQPPKETAVLPAEQPDKESGAVTVKEEKKRGFLKNLFRKKKRDTGSEKEGAEKTN
jgi:hypothetical protein